MSDKKKTGHKTQNEVATRRPIVDWGGVCHPCLVMWGVAAAAGIAVPKSDVQAPAPDRLSGLSEFNRWINTGPWQPRRVFAQDALAELADSIRQKGIVQPILVRPSPDRPTRFELIAGERRWRAAQLAQLHIVPAIVRILRMPRPMKLR